MSNVWAYYGATGSVVVRVQISSVYGLGSGFFQVRRFPPSSFSPVVRNYFKVEALSC